MLTNPILKNVKSFLLYLTVWGFAAAIYFNFLLYPVNYNFDITLVIADSIIFNLLYMGLGIILWYPVNYISFENNAFNSLITSHVIGSTITNILWIVTGYLILSGLMHENNTLNSSFTNTLTWRVLLGYLYYFLIVTFYYVSISNYNSQQKSLKEQELRNLVTEAELKSLKFQINPHFIFNSLNSMSALTAIDPPRAQNMILKLSEFLRFTLANNEKQKNKLSEELANIKRYLEIEKIRFEDKFEFEEEVNEECLNVEIPNMLLQPLFENAIKHAVYDAIETVSIKLSCKKENDFLIISLQNDFENGSSIKKGAGVGLKNISDRLELVYHQKDLMKIKKENNIFEVLLYIPATNKLT